MDDAVHLFDQSADLIAMARALVAESSEARRRSVAIVADAAQVLLRCQRAAHARHQERRRAADLAVPTP